jgi:predicted Zn-dependent peptidase
MYAAHQSLDKSGFFFIGGELVRGVKLPEFRKNLLKRLAGFCETEITERSIQKIKNNYLTGLYSGLDTNAGLGSFLGERQIVFNDWRFYKQELDMYEKVTVDDVKTSCKEVFVKPSVFVSVWNMHK